VQQKVYPMEPGPGLLARVAPFGRHYGALRGRNKAEAIREYGERQVRLWRRSYDATPPPVTAEQPDDPRYAMLPPAARPRAESLRDVSARLPPYWYDAIVPDLRAGGCVLVVSHGNTLRALVKHLESIPDDQIDGLDIPTGGAAESLVYSRDPPSPAR
jgi:2,3-bisphosphoglycerate-dependent phosphoglycerate mutase